MVGGCIFKLKLEKLCLGILSFKLKIRTSDSVSYSDVTYKDVFSGDILKQKQATELFKQLLEVRTNLMNSQPVATTGPVHCM